MAMTAATSKNLPKKADPTVIAVSPCKENIIYRLLQFVNISESFDPVLQGFKSKLTVMERVIIYYRHFNDCNDLCRFFKVELGKDFTCPNDAPPQLSKYHLVETFTSCTDPEVKANNLVLCHLHYE